MFGNCNMYFLRDGLLGEMEAQRHDGERKEVSPQTKRFFLGLAASATGVGAGVGAAGAALGAGAADGMGVAVDWS